MDEKQYRALIVDDEATIRRILSFALQKEGFSCDVAADGDEGLQMQEHGEYDLVVIDLQMPHNGHSLAVELLKLPSPPVLAIHTSVVEPLLVRDLVARGVDDVIFKPTNYAAFAAKMAGLVRRRQQQFRTSVSPLAASLPHDKARTAAAADACERLSRAEVVAKLSAGGGAASMSQTALDIYQLALDSESETTEIAAAIEREPSLASEILRLGNSSHYNPAGKEISDLDKIVLRIGRRRIGELAIAANVCASMKDRLLPHMDLDLAWRRSVAAGIAAQVLIDHCRQQQIGNGIVLASVLHQLGRVSLAGTYPERYREIVDRAREGAVPIGPCEQEMFSALQAELMADVLGLWKIPTDVTGPLRASERPFAKLAELAEPDRKRAELLKTAILIGHLAVGQWEPWDLVDLPSDRLLQRLQPAAMQDVLRAARDGLASVTTGRPGRSKTIAESAPMRVGYFRAESEAFDVVAPLLRAAGLELSSDGTESRDGAIINGIDAGPEQAGLLASQRGQQPTVVICDEASSRHFRGFESVIVLPATFARLTMIRESAAAASSRVA